MAPLFVSGSVGTVALAAFLASLVEFVEALTIVLAVGSVRGWRPALTGAGLGALTLAVLTALFGPALQTVPIGLLQLVIGSLLLLFGMRWLRKAILRSAGIIALHDEDKAFQKEVTQLRQQTRLHNALFADPVAVATAFKATFLEGLEVVFIVIATGAAGHALGAAAFGAAAAGVVVLGLGVAVHRPLARVPENSLKFCVGVLLSAFGTFWLGEGLGWHWPGEDLAIVGLIAGFLLTAALATKLARR